MSVYEKISAMFEGDALCIEVNGVRVHDVCAEKAVRQCQGDGYQQWIFADGTSIITYADQWLEADAAEID